MVMSPWCPIVFIFSSAAFMVSHYLSSILKIHFNNDVRFMLCKIMQSMALAAICLKILQKCPLETMVYLFSKYVGCYITLRVDLFGK